jgi:hypothetical protein
MDNNNNNTEGFEVALEEAPPTIMYDESADDIEQLPIANDNDYDEHVVVNYHATKKYIVGAFAVGIVAFAAFFGIGMGSGHGISELVFSNRNKSAASSSISSASNMAFTASKHNGGGAKAAKAAKSSKSSNTKSGKSVTTTTTSTTPVTTTTTTSCPPRYVVNGTGLPVPIPDDGYSAFVTLPVTLNAGCNCTIANVAVAIGINHPIVGDLEMSLFSPDFTDVVLLVDVPFSDANLVAANLIKFDDSDENAMNPQTLGANVDGSGNILADTYFAQGLLFDPIGEVDPVNGLEMFNGETAAGDWTFGVADFVGGNTGDIVSVELTITCAE